LDIFFCYYDNSLGIEKSIMFMLQLRGRRRSFLDPFS
jgi:hypothetical protein